MTEKQQLMKQLTAASFAMDDIVLFLDTNPDCQEALDYYHKFREMRKEAMHTYESKYGPISKYNVHGRDYWKWIKEPWPWEGGDC